MPRQTSVRKGKKVKSTVQYVCSLGWIGVAAASPGWIGSKGHASTDKRTLKHQGGYDRERFKKWQTQKSGSCVRQLSGTLRKGARHRFRLIRIGKRRKLSGISEAGKKKNEPLSPSPAAKAAQSSSPCSGGEPSLCATVTLFVAIPPQVSPDSNKLLSPRQHSREV